MRYAVRFTNLDVLATVAGGSDLAPVRAAGRLPARAHGALPRDRAAGAQHDGARGARDGDPRDRRLALDAGAGRPADAAGGGEVGAAHVPRQGARSAQRRPDRVLRRGPGGGAADGRPRPRARLGRRDRALPGLRRNGDRRRARSRRRAGSAGRAGARRGDEGPARRSPTTLRRAPKERNKLVSILFLSDGSQTRGQLEPFEGAELAVDAGIPVYTVALGTPEGVLRGDFGPGFGMPGTPGQPPTDRASASARSPCHPIPRRSVRSQR